MDLGNNNNIGRYAGWGVLLVSAAFAADLAASGIERSLLQAPEEVKVAESAAAAPAGEQVSLTNLLRVDETASQAAVDGAAGADGASPETSEAKTAAPETAKGLEGAVLRGTIVTGGYRAAVLEQKEESKVIVEGEIIGDYRLQQVSSTWAFFAARKKHEPGLRLVLDSMVEPESKDDGSEPVIGENNPQRERPEKEPQEEIVKEKLSLDDIRAALNDTSKISTQVRVVPQAKDGQPYGTRLIFRHPQNIMSQLGLQNNDILLSVNGNPARSVEDMYQGYMTIRNAESLEFVVDRDGKETTVRYDLAK